MKDDPISEVLMRLAEAQAPEQVPLSDIMRFLDSWGIVQDEDIETRCRALAEYLRHLLEDNDIQELVRVTQEPRYINAVQKAILADKKLLGLMIVNRESILPDRIKELDRNLKGLRTRVGPKIEVIARIAGVLKILGCSERYDLPLVRPAFPDLF